MLSDLTKSYFELFNLDTTFDLDLDDLESRFRKLQKEFHPDRFVTVSEQERRIAMQLTAQINEAYQTLIKPLSRGSYMLKLEDINVNDETDTKMDASFLMEQMELREQLDELKNKKHQEKQIQDLTETIKSSQTKIINELQVCFKTTTGESLMRARNLVRELQFFEKMASQLEELDDEYL